MNALANFVIGLGAVVSVLLIGISLMVGALVPAIGGALVIMTIAFVIAWFLRLFAPKEKDNLYPGIKH